MSYKKRGQKGWVGKKEAKSYQKSERQYAKSVVDKELDMIHQGDEFREKHKKKAKKPNEEGRIKKQIAWYERMIPRWERASNEKYKGYWDNLVKSSKDKVVKMKERLKELKDS